MNHFLSFLLLAMVLGGCSGGAVRFAPTPPPPDESPARYTHPSGAFSVELPRAWAVYERNVVSLAAAAFSPPGTHTPPLKLAAVKLSQSPDLAAVMDTYQTQVRPDVGRYTEADRQAMGDGSWRLTGLRQMAGGGTQQVNTFISAAGDVVGVVEVIVTEDPALNAQLTEIINTFALQPEPTLDPTDLSTLAFASAMQLEPLNVHGWSSADGTFFITGEVANHSRAPLTEVPVRVVLYTDEGRAVTEASDMVMGYGVPSGGFAPFSLRFGDGQPALTTQYALVFGGGNWTPREAEILGSDVMTWTDEADFTEAGVLAITGEVTNTSQNTYVYEPRAVVTVFDEAQRVIGAGFRDLDDIELEPGETTAFELTVPELGGTPSRYILSVQGRP
jgi:hypothetical protein